MLRTKTISYELKLTWRRRTTSSTKIF